MAKKKTSKTTTRARISSRRASPTQTEDKAALMIRVRKAQGQAAGIGRMIADDRQCADIITQIIAARASLLAIAKTLLQDHMKRTHIRAIQEGDEVIDDMYQDLVDLLTKMVR